MGLASEVLDLYLGDDDDQGLAMAISKMKDIYVDDMATALFVGATKCYKLLMSAANLSPIVRANVIADVLADYELGPMLVVGPTELTEWNSIVAALELRPWTHGISARLRLRHVKQMLMLSATRSENASDIITMDALVGAWRAKENADVVKKVSSELAGSSALAAVI